MTEIPESIAQSLSPQGHAVQAQFLATVKSDVLATVFCEYGLLEVKSRTEAASRSLAASLTLVIREIKSRSNKERRVFLEAALRRMSELFACEESERVLMINQGGSLGYNLYRAFDRLDEVLGIDYFSEKRPMTQSYGDERAYWGAGVGVQSGYSNILESLDRLSLPTGGHVVDLGSGFGRVGFVFGLLRSDIQFTGYELVSGRVDVANRVCADFDLDTVRFFSQDLSDLSFRVPEADAYYLYDPFNAKTYERVVGQIEAWGHERSVQVVTKGHARDRLVPLTKSAGWSLKAEFDGGNLCLFGSGLAERINREGS
jgi:hypothetical protein